MRRADLISGIVLAVVGLLSIFVVIPWQIDPGPAGYMSPRLVPTMMMMLITGLALLMVARNLRPVAGEALQAIFTRADGMAALKIGGVFALALALYHWLSPLAAGIALVSGGLIVLGERRWWVIAGMPVGLMLMLWALFYKLLGTAIV